jgi:hypothetical protein
VADDIWQIRDKLPPALTWEYAHNGQVSDITVGLAHAWPAIRVVIQVRGASIQHTGEFDDHGRLTSLTINAAVGAEVTPADLRQAAVIRSLKRWEVMAREAGRQILDGIPAKDVVLNAADAAEALRSLAYSTSARRPRKRARGPHREELLRQVAAAYQDAITAGDPAPRQTIAAQFGVSPGHVGRLLVAARRPRDGQPPLLGPAISGKAGEAPAPDTPQQPQKQEQP